MRYALLGLMVLVLVAVRGSVNVAGSTTYLVTRQDDPLPGACVPTDCSLREAILAANQSPGKDTITLPSGTYNLSRMGAGEDVGLTGDLDVADSLTLTGAGPNSTTIDGLGLDRVLHITYIPNPVASVTIANVAITNGSADFGGGIFQQNSYGNLTLFNAEVSNSSATLRGGGIEAGTEADFSDGLSIVQSKILGNHADGSGGGIASGHTTIVDSLVSENSAGQAGGGIYGDNINAATNIDSSIISANSAGNGGGIAGDGSFTIDASTISGNSALNSGGGFFGSSDYQYWLDMTGSTVVGNSARYGGGLGGDPSGATYNVLRNTTISGNAATGSGGGMMLTATLSNVTMAGNIADADQDGEGDGGAFAEVPESAPPVIRNAIIADNVDLGGEANSCRGQPSDPKPLVSQGYNLIDDITNCALTGDLTGMITGTPALLGPLADNGGPTMSHALLGSSPAIDAGHPGPPGTGGTTCEASDQRGVLRYVCDIGAYEVGAIGGVTALTGLPLGGGREAGELHRLNAAILLGIVFACVASWWAWHRSRRGDSVR